MKLRNYRETKQPDLNIIPMIDIMFFLLVFFMLSTMYMVEQKTIPVNLPQATSAAIDNKTNFTVTLKDDGSIYLEDQQTDIQTLLMQATKEQKNNPSFAIIIRADKDINYDKYYFVAPCHITSDESQIKSHVIENRLFEIRRLLKRVENKIR